MAGVKIVSALFLFLLIYFGADIIALWYAEDIASLFRVLSFVFLIDIAYSLMKVLLKLPEKEIKITMFRCQV